MNAQRLSLAGLPAPQSNLKYLGKDMGEELEDNSAMGNVINLSLGTQAKDFAEYGGASVNKAAATVAATALTAEQARLMIPGLNEEALLSDEDYAALLIQGGLVIDSHRYLRQAYPYARPIH